MHRLDGGAVRARKNTRDELRERTDVYERRRGCSGDVPTAIAAADRIATTGAFWAAAAAANSRFYHSYKLVQYEISDTETFIVRNFEYWTYAGIHPELFRRVHAVVNQHWNTCLRSHDYNKLTEWINVSLVRACKANDVWEFKSECARAMRKYVILVNHFEFTYRLSITSRRYHSLGRVLSYGVEVYAACVRLTSRRISRSYLHNAYLFEQR